MKPGVYEQLVTAATHEALNDLPPDLQAFERPVDSAEAPLTLTRHLLRSLLRALSSLQEGQAPAQTVNQLLAQLAEITKTGAVEPGDYVHGELRELLAIVRKTGLTQAQPPQRPSLSLNATGLLVNARGEPRIGAEIEKELQSADRVDLLCSFLKWSGYRLVHSALEEFVSRGGALRVLTTCYLGATDARVVEELAQLGKVRISYDTRRTRLHAKAWLFHRESGFSTAYIGSSNLSSAALLDGLEWNVRLSQTENAPVLEKFQATFESYWEDGEFEPYRAGIDKSRFLSASRSERGETLDAEYGLDVRPYPFQQEILERLETERQLHGRYRNLVVAATGCGKTVIAALDYRRFRRQGGRARLLFVAHRDEILNQSLRTFRAVLRDGRFGERWTGQQVQEDHLFASVQKLHRLDLSQVAPDHFDMLIVDEFHHAEAPTYRRLLQHFRPRLLLGLTATPERADGQSILRWFDDHVAAELRLWDALERGFLCPFQYFGIHDNTDLREVRWSRGYDAGELDRVYTGHHARAALIGKELFAHVKDPKGMRALGFCAGVTHARFMAQEFAKLGLATAVVVGDTGSEERRASLRQLEQGTLQIIFTVDVFNEGVDVPAIDTVLLLRPTQSATVFVQQIGRGLRLSDGKECLTVLDFIGFSHKQFRFDVLFRGLLGGTRSAFTRQVEQGFPTLPAGCSMQLDRVARGIVLENLKSQLFRRDQLVQELVALGPEVGLGEFLEQTGCELADIYRGSQPGWVELRRRAGFDDSPGCGLVKAVGRMLHMDDAALLAFYEGFLSSPSPPYLTDDVSVRRVEMLRFALWRGGEAASSDLGSLWEGGSVRDELLELMPVLRDRVDHLDYELVEHPAVPLRVHCHYSLAEILAGFGVLTVERPHIIREGVYFHKESGCDLFFVTILKSERDYSPTTMYQDYALSPELFHWQSQSTTRADSKDGRRYQSHRLGGAHALLFVREARKDERGETGAYLFLGPAEYVGHEGERPMGITWRLKYRIPMEFFRVMRLAG